MRAKVHPGKRVNGATVAVSPFALPAMLIGLAIVAYIVYVAFALFLIVAGIVVLVIAVDGFTKGVCERKERLPKGIRRVQ